MTKFTYLDSQTMKVDFGGIEIVYEQDEDRLNVLSILEDGEDVTEDVEWKRWALDLYDEEVIPFVEDWSCQDGD